MDERTEKKLTDLRQALFEALSASEEVRRVWSELQSEGYSLYLLLEQGSLLGAVTEVAEGSEALEPEPLFQINGADLSFLRSLGIDPTRKQRGSR